MEEDTSLFKWSRIAEPRAISSKNRVTRTDDIEKWLDRIDTAATRAVVKSAKKDHRGAHPRAQTSSDEVFGEARQLLNSWLNKKTHADRYCQDDGFHSTSEGPDRLAIKREWDRLLGAQSNPLDGPEEDTRNQADSSIASAPIAELANTEGLSLVAAARRQEEWDDSQSVEAVMKRMLAREYVDKRKLKRMEATAPSPRSDLKTKLELRQERAKEARERRRLEEERRKKEKAMKREAEAEARREIMEEERKKALQSKREEELIQKEMVRIRKEMQEARRREQEVALMEQNRLRKEREEELRSIAGTSSHCSAPITGVAVEFEPCETEDSEQQSILEMQRRKEDILLAVQKGERRHASQNLKLELIRKRFLSQLVQRCFAGWFSLVLDRRLQLGRAAAIADWRLLRVTFHGWRDLVRRQRLAVEEARARREVGHEQVRLRAADGYWRLSRLRRCFAGWRLFTAQMRAEREEEARAIEKRHKMTSFLQAAAAAAEAREQEAKEEQLRMMEQPEPVSSRSRSQVSALSSPSATRVPANLPAASRDAARARQHSCGSHGDGCEPPAPPAGMTRTAKVPNSFEHRYRSQQEAIREQARRLDEQARMIEQLRFDQRQREMRREVQEIREQRERPIERPKAAAEEDKTGESDRPESSVGTDSSRVSETKPPPKKNPILQRMEMRAAERAKVKAERDEKKRLAEKKKAEEAAQHLLEQAKKEEEEKAARAREHRERRRAERAAEQERLAALARSRELQQRADSFRSRSQMRWRGLQPWKRLMALRVEKERFAKEHRERTLLGRCFAAWQSVIVEKKERENEIVEAFRSKALLRQAFSHWRLVKFYAEAMELKAANFYECLLLRRTLRAWSAAVKDQLAERWDMEMLAKNFHHEHLLKRVFSAWCELPALEQEERAREQRREAIRRRVQSLVPDFRPPTPPASSSEFFLDSSCEP